MSVLNQSPDRVSHPLVSIILIVRNGDRYLSQAIESILAQDYEPFEILVIDGQSTDHTAKIAQQFPLVRYIYQNSLGIANAYNLGISEANGDLIAFASHDDLWMPNKLSTQVNYLLKHPEAEYVLANVRFFLEPGQSWPTSFDSTCLTEVKPAKVMEVLLVRRTLFETVGLFDSNITFSTDLDWWLRVQDAAIPAAIVPETLLSKRIHEDSTILRNQETVRQEIWSSLKQSIHRKRDRTLRKEVQL